MNLATPRMLDSTVRGPYSNNDSNTFSALNMITSSKVIRELLFLEGTNASQQTEIDLINEGNDGSRLNNDNDTIASATVKGGTQRSEKCKERLYKDVGIEGLTARRRCPSISLQRFSPSPLPFSSSSLSSLSRPSFSSFSQSLSPSYYLQRLSTISQINIVSYLPSSTFIFLKLIYIYNNDLYAFILIKGILFL